MQISNTIALVTGANRGLGLAFSRELVRRGAAKVYGAARHPDQVTESVMTPVGLDITDQDQVAAVAARCSDVSLLVNNAGVMRASTFTGAPNLDERTRTVKASLSRDHELIYPPSRNSGTPPSREAASLSSALVLRAAPVTTSM